ncbi:CoA transferase [Cupriavidus necator]
MSLQLMKGLRVVESSAFVAAPLAGMTLAQAGAEVIRIDLPGGGIDYARLPVMPGGRSLYWTGLNKGKKSLAVDIRRPEGRELVQALATSPGDDAGVLLTNLGNKWLSHESLSSRRADVITCTIEGNADGSTAVDYTVNCAVGFPTMTGDGSAPVNHVLPAWDIACAYQAAFAVSAAIASRRQTGAGAALRIALSDVAFTMLSHLGFVAEAELLHESRAPIGNYLYGAFGRDFVTSDGRRLFVAGISQNQWKNLIAASALEAPLRELELSLGRNFKQEGDRFAAREEIATLFAAWFRGQSYEAATAVLDAHSVCWGPYQTVPEALTHDPRLSERNPVFSRVNTPGIGTHLSASSSIRMSNVEPTPTAPAPLLGQHTDHVLMDILGLDAGAVGRLHDAGIVAGPDKDPLYPANGAR